MLTVEDKELKLHELYAQRKMYVFTFGLDWFNQQAEAIHREWLMSGTWLDVTEQEVMMDMTAWEIENNYLEDA